MILEHLYTTTGKRPQNYDVAATLIPCRKADVKNTTLQQRRTNVIRRRDQDPTKTLRFWSLQRRQKHNVVTKSCQRYPTS